MQEVSKKVRKAIEKVVREELSRYDVTVRDISAGMDHLGEEEIFITLAYGEDETPIVTQELNRLSRETFRALEKLGEARYPFYRHAFNAGRKFEPV